MAADTAPMTTPKPLPKPEPENTAGCLDVLLPATATEPEQHLRYILMKPGYSRTMQHSEKSQKPEAHLRSPSGAELVWTKTRGGEGF